MQKQFYLLPILDAGTTVLKSGFKVRTVQVASVTKEKGVDTLAQISQRSNPEADLAKFTSGVVFVIDASALDAALHRPHPRRDGRGVQAGRGGEAPTAGALRHGRLPRRSDEGEGDRVPGAHLRRPDEGLDAGAIRRRGQRGRGVRGIDPRLRRGRLRRACRSDPGDRLDRFRRPLPDHDHRRQLARGQFAAGDYRPRHRAGAAAGAGEPASPPTSFT